MNTKESKVETLFFVENDCLVIQQGNEKTTFDKLTTIKIHLLLTRKLYGETAVIIEGKADE